MDINEPEEAGFDEAVTEALTTIREAYPEQELPDGNAPVEDLTSLLGTSDQNLSREAAQVISMLAEQFPDEVTEAVPTLLEHIDAEDRAVRKHVLLALGYVSKSHPERVQPAVDQLVDIIENTEADIASNAAWIVSNIASADSRAIEPAVSNVIELIDHEDERVQRHAVKIIGAIAAEYPDATRPKIPRLLELLRSKALYRPVGKSLVQAAPTFGEPLVEELFDCLSPGQPALREHAAWTFVPLAEDHPELVWSRWADLIEIVRTDDDQQVQNSIAASLAAIACYRTEPDRLADLIDLLNHDDPFVRRYGCLALGDVAMETGNPRVIEALNDARGEHFTFISDQAEQILQNVASKYPEGVAEVSPDITESMENDAQE